MLATSSMLLFVAAWATVIAAGASPINSRRGGRLMRLAFALILAFAVVSLLALIFEGWTLYGAEAQEATR